MASIVSMMKEWVENLERRQRRKEKKISRKIVIIK